MTIPLLVCPPLGFFTNSLFISFWPLSIDIQLVIPSLLTNLGIFPSSQLAMIASSQCPPTLPTGSSSLNLPQKHQLPIPSLLSHKCSGWEANKTKDRALGNINIHQNLHGRKRKRKQRILHFLSSGSLGQTNTNAPSSLHLPKEGAT